MRKPYNIHSKVQGLQESLLVLINYQMDLLFFCCSVNSDDRRCGCNKSIKLLYSYRFNV